MTERRSPADPADETSDSSAWQRLDEMLDEAGLESFPASDVPSLMVDGPVRTAQPHDDRGVRRRGGPEDRA